MHRIGVDIVEIRRIQEVCDGWGNRFLNRVFSARERDYCLSKKNPFPSLAGRFAAKEAVMKAMRKPSAFDEIEIFSGDDNEPRVYLSGKAAKLAEALGVKGIEVAISHCREYAVATALVEY